MMTVMMTDKRHSRKCFFLIIKKVVATRRVLNPRKSSTLAFLPVLLKRHV